VCILHQILKKKKKILGTIYFNRTVNLSNWPKILNWHEEKVIPWK